MAPCADVVEGAMPGDPASGEHLCGNEDIFLDTTWQAF
jgi:hypothetical protein